MKIFVPEVQQYKINDSCILAVIRNIMKCNNNIILSNPVKNINNVKGYFRKELDYIIKKGFSLSSDGTRMVKYRKNKTNYWTRKKYIIPNCCNYGFYFSRICACPVFINKLEKDIINKFNYPLTPISR